MAGLGNTPYSAGGSSGIGGFGSPGSGGNTPVGGRKTTTGTPGGPVANAGAANIKQLAGMISGPVAQPSQPKQPQAPMVNSSTTNPTIDNTVLPTLLERAKGGMGADTAIRLAQGSTRDMLSGTLKELEGNAARRGIGGSGAEGLMKSKAVSQAQRDMSKQSSDIAYSAEQDRNNLYKDIAGIAQTSDSMQNEQRRLGLSQWQAQRNADLGQQRINQARDDRLLSILTQALF